MKVNLLLFAGAKEIAGTHELKIEIEEPFTVANLKRHLVQSHADLESLIGRSAFSVDQKYASDETTISANDEVAMIPPVSGG